MSRALPSVLLVLCACSDPSIVVGELAEITAFPATPNRDLDILFVIDDSPSMQPKQAALAASFPRMMDVLSQTDGGLPNVHIGVVTSDMGTSSATAPPGPAIGTPGVGGCDGVGRDGELQHADAPTLAGSFISDVAGPNGARERNYTGELRDVFAQIATVGETGCGFEQHLAAMRRALTNPANAGFVRAEANLAVVIIADEDDCSALAPGLFEGSAATYGPLQSFRCTRYGIECDPDTMTEPGAKTGCGPRAASPIVEDVQPFVDALVELKGDPRRVMVSAIVGDPAPVDIVQRDMELALGDSCQTGEAVVANPAVRLAAFLDAFPGRSQLTSICSNDLTGSLGLVGASAKKLVGDPCLDAPLLDASPELAGLQPACEVVDVPDGSPADARALPTCSSTSGDCFEIVADAAACPTAPEHLRVRVRRATNAPLDTWMHVRCQVQR